MEPINWLISSGIGAAAGVACAEGYRLVRRRLNRPKWTDCRLDHEIAASEKNCYGQWFDGNFTKHQLECEKYRIERVAGIWTVVGVPVGERPREEVLCEHLWVNPGGMSAAICSKCNVPKEQAYRLPTIEERPRLGTHRKRTA